LSELIARAAFAARAFLRKKISGIAQVGVSSEISLAKDTEMSKVKRL
jgi:hypothetical protein